MMEPLPPEVGKLKFSIKRVTNFITKLTPTYEMSMKLGSKKFNIIQAKKVAFKKTSYYQIS